MDDSRHDSPPVCGANQLPLQIILLFRFSLVLWEIWVRLHFINLLGVPTVRQLSRRGIVNEMVLQDVDQRT
jgi:hypothetical protein